MKANVAGAPVSFGVFELTPEGAETITADQMLETLQSSGYTGVDLGPLGFLGRDAELQARLRRFDLSLAGGWVQLPFSDDDAYAASMKDLTQALRQFALAAESTGGPLPLPTLADDGSFLRRAAPGRGEEVDNLDANAWGRLTANVSHAAALVRAAGFEPTFHHHAGTFVESPTEIDRFLADVDVDLTLDTGHLFLAGGDPAEAVARWGARINHLHLKDVDVTALRRVLASGGGMADVWASGSFVALGHGDIDLVAVMSELDRRGYDGWIVVEQDVLNGPNVSIDEFVRARSADQIVNRDSLRPWL